MFSQSSWDVLCVSRKILHDNTDHGEVWMVRGVEGHHRAQKRRWIPQLQDEVRKEPLWLGLHVVPQNKKQGRCLCCLNRNLKMMSVLNHLIHRFKSCGSSKRLVFQLVFQDVATPLTNMHYLGSQRGAMYSAEHNLERFYAEAVARNRCNTPVKNLYISGMKPLSWTQHRRGLNPDSGTVRGSVCSRSGRVQLWDCRRSARRTPLRLYGFGSHCLRWPTHPQEEAEEEESQRDGSAGKEEAAISALHFPCRTIVELQTPGAKGPASWEGSFKEHTIAEPHTAYQY